MSTTGQINEPISYLKDSDPLIPQGTSNAEFVALLYKEMFDHTPDAVGRDYWIAQLDKGVSRQAVATAFATSNEYNAKAADNKDYIDHLYEDIFDRMPDSSGETYWINELDHGLSKEQIAQSFIASSEFTSVGTKPIAINGLTYSGKDGYAQPFTMQVLAPGEKANMFSLPKTIKTTINDGSISFNSNKQYIDLNLPTFVYTHGWTDNGDINSANGSAKSKVIYDTFVQKYGNNANVIIVDWQTLAKSRDPLEGTKEPTYESSVTKQVGEVVADALLKSGVNLSKTTLIGHSLGSFVMSAAANQILQLTGDKVGELVALDTAATSPLFSEYDIDARNGYNRGKDDAPYDFTTAIAQKTTSFTVMNSDAFGTLDDASSLASNSTRAATAQKAYLVGYVPQVDPNIIGPNGPAEVSNYHNGVVSAYANLVATGNLDPSIVVTRNGSYNEDGEVSSSGPFDGIIATNQPWIGNAADQVGSTGTSFRFPTAIGWVYNDPNVPQVFGTPSNDTLFFSKFYKDVKGVEIFGGAGNDFIGSNSKIDFYTGGLGADTFYFSFIKDGKKVDSFVDGSSSANDSHAVIMDLNPKEDFIQFGFKADQIKYEQASKFNNGLFAKDFDSKHGSDGVVFYLSNSGKNDVIAYAKDITVAQIDDAVASGHVIFDKTVNLDQLLFLS